MSPLTIAVVITAVGCVLHFIFSQPAPNQPTLALLGKWTILAGAWAITSILITLAVS